MSIKFEIDRADNGNKFLCRDCQYAFIRSGRLNEEDVTCEYTSPPQKIDCVVTKCSKYSPPDIMKFFVKEGEKFYGEQAYYYATGINVKTKEREFRFVDFPTFRTVRMTGFFPSDEEEEEIPKKE